VTVSGTVILALTVGLPTVGYRSPFLESVLPADSLVTPGDVQGLAKAASDAATAGRDNFLVEATELDANCSLDWRAVLELAVRDRSL
jgi:hypothetical protein